MPRRNTKANKNSSKQIDPTQDPIDVVESADEQDGVQSENHEPSAVDEQDESGEIRQSEPNDGDKQRFMLVAKSIPMPEQVGVDNSLDQLMKMVSESTPTSFEGNVSRRINDTGNVLTPRQSIAYERISRFAISEKALFWSRSGRDQTPCHKKAHVMRYLLDRMADLLEEYDAKE